MWNKWSQHRRRNASYPPFVGRPHDVLSETPHGFRRCLQLPSAPDVSHRVLIPQMEPTMKHQHLCLQPVYSTTTRLNVLFLSITPTDLNMIPTGTKHHTPRFFESSPATDAGPGAYIPSDFASRGPAYSMAARPSKTLDVPDSPGPGQYIEVQLSVRQPKRDSGEGFGKRDSPRFAAGEILSVLLNM